jgi:hypothetical protein
LHETAGLPIDQSIFASVIITPPAIAGTLSLFPFKAYNSKKSFALASFIVGIPQTNLA